jgi:uncharacterized protein (DUF885 family)
MFMKNISLLLLSLFYFTTPGLSQEKKEPKPKDTAVDTLLKAISNFHSRESKRDSLLDHPLGSNAEEDFFRRYTFYDSVYSQLNKIDKDALPFDAQINLELVKYDAEDELSTWKFKSYLNPILSDEGFHTSLAAMGSQVLSSKKEFENYIKKLKDIPRSVN